jgi:hypothetical protein
MSCGTLGHGPRYCSTLGHGPRYNILQYIGSWAEVQHIAVHWVMGQGTTYCSTLGHGPRYIILQYIGSWAEVQHIAVQSGYKFILLLAAFQEVSQAKQDKISVQQPYDMP